MKKIFLVFIVLSLVSSAAFAGTVVLKSGKVFDGRILKETDYFIRVRLSSDGSIKEFLMDNVREVRRGSVEQTQDLDTTGQESIVVPAKKEESKSSLSEASRIRDMVDSGKISAPIVSDDDYLFDEEEPQNRAEKLSGSDMNMLSADMMNVNAGSSRRGGMFLLESKKDFVDSMSVTLAVIYISSFFIAYILACLPLFLIAKKTSTPHAGWSWLPVLQVFLMLRIAKKPWWWFFLLFIVPVNIIVSVLLFVALADACKQSRWFVLLTFIPHAFLWYLAICKMEKDEYAEKNKEPLPEVKEPDLSGEITQEITDRIIPPTDPTQSTRF